MNPQWEKVKEIFDLAVEQSVSSRPNFLREKCGQDEELFREIESLLKVYDEPENLIEENAINFNSTPKKSEPIIHQFIHLPYPTSQLKGDLDNIILMALEKEPARRYASVLELNNDIERFLKGLPIKAHPNSIGYRAGKFVKRNKISVLAFGLILLSLITGLSISLWQYRKSQREAEKAAAVNSFMQRILLIGNPENTSPNQKGYSTTITDVLKETIKRLENGELDNQPEVKAEVMQVIAETLVTQNEYNSAEKLLKELILFKSQLYGETHLSTIQTKIALASLFTQTGKSSEAAEIYQQILPKLFEGYKAKAIETTYLSSALSDFALICRARGDSLQAENLYRQNLEIAFENKMPVQYRLGTQALLSLTLSDQGKFDEAEKYLRQSIETLEQESSAETIEMSNLKTALGSVLTEKGNLEEAEISLKEAERIYRKLQNPNSIPIFDNLRLQAQVLYKKGKLIEAEKSINYVVEGYEKNATPTYINYATALTIKGLTLNQLGKTDKAEEVLRKAVQIRLENLPSNHFMSALTKSALGEILTNQKNFSEAEPLLRESYESLKTSQGEDNQRTNLAKSRLEKLKQFTQN